MATTTESKSRETNHPKVRMPVELRDRIDAERARLEKNYVEGRCELPDGVEPENIPRWAVILKALDELEGHRERRRTSRRNTKTAK